MPPERHHDNKYFSYSVTSLAENVGHQLGDIGEGAVHSELAGCLNHFLGLSFDLGDLLGTVLGGLGDQNFKVDPFLTNLARGIIAAEGTIKTLSPKVNILNYFTDKVDIGIGFNLDLEHPENMNPDIAMKLLQLFNGVTDASTKTAETLDMLEKGQVRVRTNLCFEEKAQKTVNLAIRALMIIALFIGSCLMCTASAILGIGGAISILFLVMGLVGYGMSIFFTYRLYNHIKKGK